METNLLWGADVELELESSGRLVWHSKACTV